MSLYRLNNFKVSLKFEFEVPAKIHDVVIPIRTVQFVCGVIHFKLFCAEYYFFHLTFENKLQF